MMSKKSKKRKKEGKNYRQGEFDWTGGVRKFGCQEKQIDSLLVVLIVLIVFCLS